MWTNKEFLEMSVMAAVLLTAAIICGVGYLVCTVYEKIHGTDDSVAITPSERKVSEAKES